MLHDLPTLPPLVQALGFPSLSPALLSVSPPFGHLSEAAFPVEFPTNRWADKRLDRPLPRRLSHSGVGPAFFVLHTNPLPFMGLQPLGYLSYLPAREARKWSAWVSTEEQL